MPNTQKYYIFKKKGTNCENSLNSEGLCEFPDVYAARQGWTTKIQAASNKVDHNETSIRSSL